MSDSGPPILPILLILVGLIPAFIARRRGRSFILWFGAIIFPVALPASLFLKNKNKKQCNSCNEFSRSAPVRMVPVSAVGDNFAWFDPATGKMKKQPDALARPYNVDVSLALTLYDHLKIITTASTRESLPKLPVKSTPPKA
jgi:hypothetical protein